jgi:prevent-host-death family protein
MVLDRPEIPLHTPRWRHQYKNFSMAGTSRFRTTRLWTARQLVAAVSADHANPGTRGHAESDHNEAGPAQARVVDLTYWLRLKIAVQAVILVSVTRIAKSKKTKAPTSRRRKRVRRPGRWLLQDAKARFSELVRRVRSEGPQHVTVHGRDEVVVIAAEDFRRLKGDLTGEALVAVMQASPHRDIEIEPKRSRLPARDVHL